MSLTTSYATRAHPDPNRSLFAVAVGPDVTVTQGRGRGLTLEARALLKALGATRGAEQRGQRIDHVHCTPALAAALTRRRARHLGNGAPKAATEFDRVLDRLVRFLDAHPRTLAQTPMPEDLLEALAGDDRAVHDLDTDLDIDDLAWVADRDATVVYTDASVDNELRLGTWAYYVSEEHHATGQVPFLATPFLAEQYAARQALDAIPGPVLLVVDNWDIEYGSGHYARIQGLGEILSETLTDRGAEVRVKFVKGHHETLGNHAADQLANDARHDALAALAADPDALRTRQEVVADFVAQTAEYRAGQQVKQAWYQTRAREVVTAEHPGWSSLPATERTRLGREITLRLREEYAATHPADGDVPDTPALD